MSKAFSGVRVRTCVCVFVRTIKPALGLLKLKLPNLTQRYPSRIIVLSQKVKDQGYRVTKLQQGDQVAGVS